MKRNVSHDIRVILAIEKTEVREHLINGLSITKLPYQILTSARSVLQLPLKQTDYIILETYDDISLIVQIVYELYWKFDVDSTLPITAMSSEKAFRSNPAISPWIIDGHEALTTFHLTEYVLSTCETEAAKRGPDYAWLMNKHTTENDLASCSPLVKWLVAVRQHGIVLSEPTVYGERKRSTDIRCSNAHPTIYRVILAIDKEKVRNHLIEALAQSRMAYLPLSSSRELRRFAIEKTDILILETNDDVALLSQTVYEAHKDSRMEGYIQAIIGIVSTEAMQNNPSLMAWFIDHASGLIHLQRTEDILACHDSLIEFVKGLYSLS